MKEYGVREQSGYIYVLIVGIKAFSAIHTVKLYSSFSYCGG
jgi:hypothetical protein